MMRTLFVWIVVLQSLTISQDVQLLKIRGSQAFQPPNQGEISKAFQDLENFITRIEQAKIDRKAKDPTIDEAKSGDRLVFSTRMAQKSMLDKQKNTLLKLKNEIWNQVPWQIPRLPSNSLEIGKAGYLTSWWKDDGRKTPRTVPAITLGSVEHANYMAKMAAMAEEARNTACEVEVLRRSPSGEVTCAAGDYVVIVHGLKPSQASNGSTMTITDPLYVKNVQTINGEQVPELHPLDPKIIDQVKREVMEDAVRKKIRDWKSADRKFSVEASLISLADKKATLQKGDGKKIEIDLNQLSKADRDYCVANLGLR